MLDGATVPAVVARTAHSSMPIARLDRPADILTVTRGRLGGTSRTRSKTRPGRSWARGASQFGPRQAGLLGGAANDAEEHASTNCGFLCQSTLPLLGLDC